MSTFVFWLSFALAVLGVIVLIVGLFRKQRAAQLFGTIVVVAALCLLFVQLFAPATKTAERRVVYSQNGEVVVINDENGCTERLTLKKVAHKSATYSVGDNVVIIYDGAGAPIYFTTDGVVPQKELTP